MSEHGRGSYESQRSALKLPSSALQTYPRPTKPKPRHQHATSLPPAYPPITVAGPVSLPMSLYPRMPVDACLFISQCPYPPYLYVVPLPLSSVCHSPACLHISTHTCPSFYISICRCCLYPSLPLICAICPCQFLSHWLCLSLCRSVFAYVCLSLPADTLRMPQLQPHPFMVAYSLANHRCPSAHPAPPARKPPGFHIDAFAKNCIATMFAIFATIAKSLPPALRFGCRCCRGINGQNTGSPETCNAR